MLFYYYNVADSESPAKVHCVMLLSNMYFQCLCHVPL